jgi:two-component system cell cycle sensor histidine kinase/response regulator CckA
MTTAPPAIRVALIEDDDDVRGAIEELLIDEGFEVTAFPDGLDAIQALRSGGIAPDLILLDLGMRKMDGWQFRLEQKNDRVLGAVPVLAMSADGSAKARAIDSEGFIAKPLHGDTLLSTMREVIATAERRRTQQAQGAFERMASLGTLAAGVAHEINNPLAFISANLRLLVEELPEVARDVRDPALHARLVEWQTMVDECIEGTSRIQSIVRGIRSFSHVDETPRAAVDIPRALDSAINLATSEIRQRARLVKVYDPIPMVMANEGKLGQVFLNLIVNAAQAMREGNVDNVITVSTGSDDRGDAIVTVRDTGEGIRPELRQRIFEPFFTTKPVGSGVGLGLSICHGIIVALGGEITVDSEIGRGSLFTVRLPRATSPSRTPAPTLPTSPSVLPTDPEPRGRILVIDDEPTLARVLVRQLGKRHDVRAVTSGREALNLLRQGEHFDAILSDLLMPDVTGMDLHDEVAKLYPGLEHRIIFMTGGAFTPRAREFVATASNPFLEKPIDVPALTAALREILSPEL